MGAMASLGASAATPGRSGAPGRRAAASPGRDVHRLSHLLEDLIDAEACRPLAGWEVAERIEETRDFRLCGDHDKDV